MAKPQIWPGILLACSLGVTLGPCAAQEAKPPKKTRAQARSEFEKAKLDKVSAVVRGQCVDAITGKPLAGCTVTLKCWGGRRDDDVPQKLMRPDPVTTGADGRFAVRVLARERYQVGLDITFPGCWPRTGRWYHMLPGEVDDLGKIKLHKGVCAVGKVVNTKGEPVAGVSVGIDELPLYIGVEKDKDDHRPLGERLRENAQSGKRAFHLHANKVRYGTTGADGMFKSRDALPPGTHELRISGRAVQLLKPKKITIPETGPMPPVTIVLKQQPCISGVVVDKQGKPVKGVSLHAGQLRGGRLAGGRRTMGTTRADGSFKIYRADRSPDKVAIDVSDPGPCEYGPPTAELEWGTTGVKIVLARALTAELTVIEAKSGKPIEDFAIRCYPNQGRSMRIRQSGHHAGGKLVVEQVRRGAGFLVVIPKDMQLLPAKIAIDGKANMTPLSVEVERLVPKKLLVLDTKGEPVEGVQVQVIVPGNYQRGNRDLVNDPRADGMGAFSTDPNTTFDTLVYKATTNAGGQCIVYGMDGREDLILGLRLGSAKTQRFHDVAFGMEHLSRKIQLAEWEKRE